ncbi:MAG TPA: DNA-processing protein DprA [Thermohalobaculum sp.]|nr:DNA-processing protein DprA [Thermohalobaculum sp.]
MSVAEPVTAIAAQAERLTDSERLARLRLARSLNVGPRTYAHLLNRFGSGARALDALPSLAAGGGKGNYLPFPLGDAEAEIDAGNAAGAKMILLGETSYPPLLATIDHPPPVLWATGSVKILLRPAIAIVGARNASALGLRTARNLARGLGETGQVIVSGLARGIDAAAHESSIETGTIAVMAGGIDQIYPPEHDKLAARIAGTGALLSECPMGMEPTSRHFPAATV